MDWSNIVSALIGGALALSGPVVQNSIARRAEVRQRTDVAALAAQELLAEINDFCKRCHDPEVALQGNEKLSELLRRFRIHVVVIADAKLRERLSFIARTLGYTTAIQAFHGDNETQAGLYLCEWGEDLIGSHLRGERLPREPERVLGYRAAISEADEIEDEHHTTNCPPLLREEIDKIAYYANEEVWGEVASDEVGAARPSWMCATSW